VSPGHDFAVVLRSLRRKAFLTQEQAAERCGVAVRTLRNLESGRTAPRPTTIRRLIAGLGAEELDATLLQEAHWIKADSTPRDTGPRFTQGAPHQLPADTGHFTGRRYELDWLDGAMGAGATRKPPAVVIAGAAGLGKTTLAVWWARHRATPYRDGELYVDLRGSGPEQPIEPAAVLIHLLTELGVEPAGRSIHELAAAWRSTLASRELMLLLDNAESAEQVRPLLPASAGTGVLVTSRSALPGLVARDGASRITLNVLPADDSVRLLASVIGHAARRERHVVQRLAEACAHLPLALRIAGELVTANSHMSLAELADRLERDPLSTLDKSGDPHTALRSVLMSSYRVLPESAARAFTLLGISPTGQVDRTTAAHLFGLTPEATDTQLDLLTSAHMINRLDRDRFAMHDLLHAFAAELADGLPEAGTAAFHRLSDHLLAQTRVAVSARDPQARHELADRGSMLQAVMAAANRRRLYDVTLAFADSLTDHLEVVGAYEDLLVVLRESLVAAERVSRAWDAAEIRRRIGVAHYMLGQPEPASDNLDLALGAYRALGDRCGEARCLNNAGSVRWRSGRAAEALELYNRSLEIYRSEGDRNGEADLLCNLGILLKDQGRNAAAIRNYESAIAIYQRMNRPRSAAVTFGNLGVTLLKIGRFDDAREALVMSWDLAREVGDRYAEGIAQENLGEVCLNSGDHSAARRHFLTALLIAREVGDQIGEGLAADLLGVVHRHLGHITLAGLLHGRGRRLARRAGNRDGECVAIVHLAEIAIAHGDVDTAGRLAAAAAELADSLNKPTRTTEVLTVLADVQERTGAGDAALANRRRALACARRSGDVIQQRAALDRLARHHEERGRTHLAARHSHHAATLLVTMVP
jgi:tetratricopeptide (TPR) repeat protein/transcriptional regulator with XRE-family HTH domain